MNNQHLATLVVDAILNDLRERKDVFDERDMAGIYMIEHELKADLRTVVLTLLNRHVGRNV
jgi:hypothetical protein